MKGLIVSLIAITLVLGVSIDARAQEDDTLVRWGEEVSELERMEMTLGNEAAWRAEIAAAVASSVANLPDLALARRMADPARLDQLADGLNELYGASREVLYYRFAPAFADWAVEPARKASRELDRRLDRVSSMIIKLDAPTAALPDDLARLPLFSKLDLLSRSMDTMRPKFKQIMRATDIIDLNLLKDVNSEFRVAKEIVRALRR
jgi:hypothetical protein